MAVELQALTAGNCNNCIGGIVRSAYIDCEYIDWDNSTVDANGHVTAIAVTLAGANQFKEFLYDRDKTAKHDSVGERTGSRHVSKGEAFHKWDCLNIEKIDAGEALKNACCLVGIHEYADGMQAIQGADVVPDGAGYRLEASLEPARATVSALSDTSANSSRLEVTVTSESRNVLVVMADPAVFGLDDALDL